MLTVGAVPFKARFEASEKLHHVATERAMSFHRFGGHHGG
jgi:hypothetical protein